MGYTKGGLGKNGYGIVVPFTPEMGSSRKSLGFDVIASLHTPNLDSTKKVLFVIRGVQTKLLEE